MSTTRLFGIFGVLFLVNVAALAGFALLSIEKSAYWDARIQLAQQSYQAHRRLESDVFQLIAFHAAPQAIDGAGEDSRQEELQENVLADIATIRTIIAAEIELVGEEEIEELAALSRIEREILAVFRLLPLAPSAASRAPPEALVPGFVGQQVQERVAPLIDAALDEEQEEVDETLATASALRERIRAILLTLSSSALLLVAGFIVAHRRMIRHPLEQTEAILARFRKGDWTGPIRIEGGQEFRSLGQVLREMADSLLRREAETRSESDRLEAMVDARTAEQRRLIAEIERNASQKRQLLADISHELRTPLTIIQGEAEVTLRRGEQPAEIYQDALARIRDSARHTNRIVDDLLLISRQEAAQLRLDRHEHDVRSILREAAETFPRDVALDLPEAPLHAYVDALRLRQCMLALFQNARRHGGPHIAASAREADGRLLLIVEDDGPGLSDGEKAQAFDRFFRGSGASGNEEGHGLGLPIVRSIVQAHDGTVDLADVETGGLRVIVDLPLRPTPRLVANRPEGPEPDPGIPDALNLRNKGGA